MPSLVAWLDSTPEEQKAARELVALFSEKESRDELGIGPIRDAFSDLLFPGTSVLQTRARYYLFVPWCYSTADMRRLAGAAYRDRGRGHERTLIKTLREASFSDRTGLIGARAGVGVRNLPSDIYWNGMLRYAIREHGAAIGAVKILDELNDGATELVVRSPTEWSPTLPPVPAKFPHEVEGGFALTRDEAAWLAERIVAATEGTVLAQLVEQGHLVDPNSPAPWESVDETQFEELHHARMFSRVMHGAALLYNLLIAKRFVTAGLREESGHDLVGEYEERLTNWQEGLDHEVHSWDFDRMWELTARVNPGIPERTKVFVRRWVTGLRGTDDSLRDTSLQELVAERERRKGTQSRLQNEKMLAAWSGASGTAPMTYRWGTVKVLVNDIIGGLDDAGA